MTKTSPPTPALTGSTRFRTAAVATAASNAFPPCLRICKPAWAAKGWLVATTPLRASTSERVWGSQPAARSPRTAAKSLTGASVPTASRPAHSAAQVKIATAAALGRHRSFIQNSNFTHFTGFQRNRLELLRKLHPDQARLVDVVINRLHSANGWVALRITIVLGQPVEHIVDEQLYPEPALLRTEAGVDQRVGRLLAKDIALHRAHIRPNR